MSNKTLKQYLLIRDDESHRYSEIDVSDWEPGENFIGLSTGEDFPEGEEWFLYYPWQGETKIDHRFENGRLWVNGRVAGIDLREVKLNDLEDRTTVVTVKALPTQLTQVQKLPNVLVLEILEGEGDLSPLAKLTTLTKLTMWPRINDTHLAYVERLINLRELHVYSDRITEAGLVHVKGLKKLRHLDLLPMGNGNGWLTDASLGYLADLVNLRGLSLFWEKVTDKGLSHIEGMTELTQLSLDGNKITDEGLRHLRGLKELTELSLDFTEITDDGLKHLSHLTNLKELSLMATAISDDGLKHLKGLHSLETLILIDTPITDTGLEKLHGLTDLKVINLSETKVTKEGVERFKKILPNCVVMQNVRKIRSSKSRYTSGSG